MVSRSEDRRPTAAALPLPLHRSGRPRSLRFHELAHLDRRCRAVALAASLLAGCAEQLSYPDWVVPVTEGTPVREYAHVAADERTASIEWVEELVIGDRGEVDMRYAFSRPSDVTVDSRGQIYVVDAQASKVKVFDENGGYLRELGRQGQGPGEFQRPRSIAGLVDRVVVGASRNARWSHFDLDGNYVDDFAYPRFDNLELVSVTPAGEVVGSTVRFSELDQITQGYGLYSPQAELRQTIVEIDYTQIPTIQRGDRRTYFSTMPRAYPQVAVAPDGSAYWSTTDEYQILAVDADGTQRWAARVAWTPPDLTRDEIDAVMAMVRRSYEDAVESEVNFPDRQPALSRMLVDGHGHLYVWAYVPDAVGVTSSAPIPAPVDVYGPDGERLFTGMTEARTWVHTDGDHVWEIGVDAATEENVVRKVRLVEPFE